MHLHSRINIEETGVVQDICDVILESFLSFLLLYDAPFREKQTLMFSGVKALIVLIEASGTLVGIVVIRLQCHIGAVPHLLNHFKAQGNECDLTNPFPWFSATNKLTMLQSNPASGRAPDRRHPANCTPPR